VYHSYVSEIYCKDINLQLASVRTVPFRGRLVTWLRVRFTRSHTKCRLVKKKKLLFDGRTHQNVSRTRSSILLLLVGKKAEQWSMALQWSHAPLLHCSF